MAEIFNDIQNYILFLRQKGYSVSFSSFDDHFHPYTAELLQHEIHLHSVCSYLKSNPKTLGMCVRNKAKLSKCKITKPTFSCCYAGVEEYIFPVYYNNIRILCIHISGYRDNLKLSRRLKFKTSLLCSPTFIELYSQLSPEKPSFEMVESFVKPLEYMLKELYRECQNTSMKKPSPSTSEQLYLKTLQYINDNYMNDISAETIGDVLGYSTSYVRTVFKKLGGRSLQNKINDIRLENARFLLLNTTMTVTDVAIQCGFVDSNYFSVVFKKKYGIPPLIYRKSN